MVNNDVEGAVLEVEHSENETPVLWGVLAYFGCENKTGLRRLITFQDRPLFSHIYGKLSPRPFELYG